MNVPRVRQERFGAKVLDALKMILIGASLNEVLTCLTRLIEAHSEGMLCSIFLAGQGLRERWRCWKALAGWVIPWGLPYTSGLSVAMPAVSHKPISSTLPTRK